MAHTSNLPSRRTMLGWLGAAASGAVLAACGSGEAAAKGYPLSLTREQWKARLTPDQFRVLREKATEYPWSSGLLNEHRKGTFLCAGCAIPLFSSATKFDSKTGWPSFWRPLPGAVGTATDWDAGQPRTEVHCANCGGHLGHVFDDGPAPTFKRYCMNGVALAFRPA